MKKFRFLKFKVDKDAIRLRLKCQKIIKKHFPLNERFVLKNQLLRAATSIILNIAEGSNRSTNKDFANFLNISRTSLDEVVACFDIALAENYISKELHQDFLKEAENLSNQLTAFRKKLLSDL
jgi:four helix bundle protein